MKSIKDIKTIAIAGAGTMGAGIAQICSAAGYQTILYDLNDDAINRGINIISKNLDGAVERGKMTSSQKDDILKNIKTATNLEEVKADVIIEAVLEKLDIKREL